MEKASSNYSRFLFILSLSVGLSNFCCKSLLAWPRHRLSSSHSVADNPEPTYLRNQSRLSRSGSVAHNPTPTYIQRSQELDRWVQRNAEERTAQELNQAAARLERAKDDALFGHIVREKKQNILDAFKINEDWDRSVPLDELKPEGPSVWIYVRPGNLHILLSLVVADSRYDKTLEKVKAAEEFLETQIGSVHFKVSVDLYASSDPLAERDDFAKLKIQYGKTEREKGVWGLPSEDPLVWNPQAHPVIWAQNIMRILGIGYLDERIPLLQVSGLMQPPLEAALSTYYLDAWDSHLRRSLTISGEEAILLLANLLIRDPQMKGSIDRQYLLPTDPKLIPARVRFDVLKEKLSQAYNPRNMVGPSSPPSERQCRLKLRDLRSL